MVTLFMLLPKPTAMKANNDKSSDRRNTSSRIRITQAPDVVQAAEDGNSTRRYRRDALWADHELRRVKDGNCAMEHSAGPLSTPRAPASVDLLVAPDYGAERYTGLDADVPTGEGSPVAAHSTGLVAKASRWSTSSQRWANEDQG